MLLVKRYPACIVGTAVVPWSPDGRFEERLFRREIDSLIANGYRNLYIFGTAGEGYAVTDDQHLEIARVFVEAMRSGGAEPMVGVISLSLQTIVARIEAARKLGVRQFQISLPSWGPLDDGEVMRFFDLVLGRFEDCSFLHYNLQRAKRLVTAREYAAIAARHPNLVATKNSTDSMVRIRGLLEEAPMLQHFLNEHGYAYGSLLGECGLLISVAATNLRLGQAYFEAGRARDVETLFRMEGELRVMGEALAGVSPGARIDGAYDKVLWKLHDPDFPLRLLPPYEAAEPDAAARYLAFLRERLPQWLP